MAWKKKLYRIVVADRCCDPVARIRFYLHKEFRAAGARFYLHKEFRAAEIRFYLHKELLKKNREISMIYLKNFPRCARQFLKDVLRKIMKNQWCIEKIFRAARAALLRISWEKSWKINDVCKNFPRCARWFVKKFLRKSWKINDVVKKFPRCARWFVKKFLGEIMKNQWYSQKFSALRAPSY